MYMYGSVAKNLPDNVGDAVSISGSRRPPREGNGNPLHLPGKSHGQQSLEGYSPWGRKTVSHNLATKQQIADLLHCTAETNTTL